MFTNNAQPLDLPKRNDAPWPLDCELLQKLVGPETTVDGHLKRLCNRLAEIDQHYEAHPPLEKTSDDFFTLIKDNLFLPMPSLLTLNSHNQLGILPHTAIKLTDDIDDIFDKLKTVSLYLQNSVNVAVDFSHLRAARIQKGSSPKQSLGPLPFMEMFAHAAQPMTKTPLRFYLQVDHLNIEDFLEFMAMRPKHIRFAIGITDEFMNCLREKKKISLKASPLSEASHEAEASPLYKKIMNLAIAHIPIDFFFIDRIRTHQKKHGCPGTVINSLNQIVLENEMMAFGAVNLLALLSANGRLDEEKIADVMAQATHFLDNCFEVNFYPTALSERTSKKTRRLCLSLMGLGLVLNHLNRENSQKKTLNLLDEIFLLLQRAMASASKNLSRERGGMHATTLRHTAILGQISTPLLCQLSGTPNYLFQKSMTLSDFYALSPIHAFWQNMLPNIASFKTPIRENDGPLFTKLFINAYQQGALTLETGE